MPRKARQPWEKVPNKWKWRCKICDRDFDSTYEAEKHIVEDCLPTRGCARCQCSLKGMRWQTKYCSASCRVMDSRDRNAGKPTRAMKKQAAARATATANCKAVVKSVLDWCDHCNRRQLHRQMPDGYWECENCGH